MIINNHCHLIPDNSFRKLYYFFLKNLLMLSSLNEKKLSNNVDNTPPTNVSINESTKDLSVLKIKIFNRNKIIENAKKKTPSIRILLLNFFIVPIDLNIQF